MSTLLLVGSAAVCAMIAVLAIFSDDIVKGQMEFKNNFIRKRKLNLRSISLSGEINKEVIKTVNKSFFTKKREAAERLISKADIKITYSEYFIICILSGVIGWLIGGFLNNILISISLSIMMYFVPKSYLSFICNNYKRNIDEQLEPVLSQIIGLLPSKKTLINACETCVGSMEEPLKTYFIEFINNINNANRSFEESLNELARKIDNKAFYDFARLAVVNYRQGGETMYAFSSIPEAMRDVKLIQSEQETELDSLKLMGYMFVSIAPISYLYYYFTSSSSFDILVKTGIGKIVTFIVFVITIITVKLIIKISKPVEF